MDWFIRHWDLLGRLVDDHGLDYLRFATCDGDQLSYRFRVIGMEVRGTIRLVEFLTID